MNENFQCACQYEKHLFKVYFDEECEQLHIIIALNKFPFWKRVLRAFDYVRGKDCLFGHFDDFILKQEDVAKLKEILIEADGKIRPQ